MTTKPLPAEVVDDDAALEVLPLVPVLLVELVALEVLPDGSPTLPLTASTTPAIGAFSTVPSRLRWAVSTATCAESTFDRACSVCAGVSGFRSAWAVSWASRTWPWAVTIACRSLSRVASWLCWAEVIASRSFCTVWSRLFSAFLRLCSAWVQELAPALLVLVDVLPVLVGVPAAPTPVPAEDVVVGIGVGVDVRGVGGVVGGAVVGVEVRVVVGAPVAVEVGPPAEGAVVSGASNASSCTPLHAVLAF